MTGNILDDPGTDGNNTGGNDGSFIESLPEELRGEETLGKFKDVGGLAKSYLEAQKMIGSSIRIPSEDASEDAHKEFYEKLTGVKGVVKLPGEDDKDGWDAFYNKLGRPAKAEDYKLNVPEGTEYDEQLFLDDAKLAHEGGFTQKQMDMIVSQRLAERDALIDQLSSSQDATAKELKNRWGAEYNNNIALAKAVGREYEAEYGDEFKKLFSGPTANNAALVAMMADLGSYLHEKGHAGVQSATGPGMSKAEALERIAEININKEHPYWKGDKDAVQKMFKLQQVANPT